MTTTQVTNLLAMPLVIMQVATGTNEDWIDSILFLVDDGAGGAPEVLAQLDITGIEFTMEVRRQPPDNEVVIRGTTKDNTLIVGQAPNHGYLLINIDHKRMMQVRPGLYVGDIIGADPLSTRRVASITLDVQMGLTRP